MANTLSKAFIDGQDIKIVNENGYEFLTLISDAKKSAKNLGYVSALFLFFSFVCVTTLVSQFILPSFSEGKNGFLLVSAIFTGLVSAVFFGIKSSYVFASSDETAKYNKAKAELQPVVLELEKTLRTHKAELLNIDNTNKFNFKKPAMEMIS